MSRQPWVSDSVGAAAFEALAADLAGSELSSVLLEVMERRASARTPKELVAQYQRDPFCARAAVDQRESVAIDAELLAAAQGIEFLRPMRSSTPVEAAHALLRAHCPPVLQDRYLAPDIERATRLVRDGSLASILRGLDGLPALWTPA